MAGFQLKVKTEVLQSQAANVSSEISKIEKEWKNIETLIKRSKGYWEGDASNQHIKYYQEVKEPVNKVISRLKEHPTDLLKMAGIYSTAEQEAAGLTNALPDEVII